MKRSMLIVMVWVFFLMVVQSRAEMRITPDGIPSSDDATSVHLSGSFSSEASNQESSAVVSGMNTYEEDEGDEKKYYAYGGLFQSNGHYGYGVYGRAIGSMGRGVYGVATNTSGNGTGVYGISYGTAGSGVYAIALGTLGYGVQGWAQYDGDVENYGGYFKAAGGKGRGVYGLASKTGSVTNYGGYFQANGSQGIGVYGYADALKATNYGGYFKAEGVNGTAVKAYGKQYNFYADGPGANYLPFTGAHEVKFGAEMPEEIATGLIVSATGKAEVRENEDGKTSLSSTLPTVTLSARERDKAVFGVIVSQGPLYRDHWYESKPGERFGVVNALGEGRVWVTNQKGAIEAGDYITTSAIPGYGQKQADDLLHSYTLGKAIETVDWDRATETIEYEGKTYKAYLIAVVYTSG